MILLPKDVGKEIDRPLEECNEDDIEIPDVGNRHILVALLLEMFSVSIHRAWSCAQRCPFSWETLSLTGSNMDTVTPSKVLEVEVDLKDGAWGIDIAKGTFTLDYTTEYDYEVATSKRVEGNHSYATVHYTTFRFAITATVNVLYTAQHDGMVLLQMFMETCGL